MAKFIKKSITLRTVVLSLLVVLIMNLAGNLREYAYASVPFPGETLDEYSFAWVGISLIKDKYPIAWSGIPGYKNYDQQQINVDGIYDKHPEWAPFSINKPWFDHPPLFGLVTGGYAYLKGVRNFIDASVIILRRPMLKIGVFSVLLVIILAWKLWGLETGLLSGLLYATIPSIVISSRMAIVENGIIPLFLLCVLFAVNYFDKRKIIYWYLACTFAAMAVLFKLSGISVPLTLICMGVCYGKREKWKLVTFSLSSIIFSLLAFIIYGYYFDSTTFWNVFTANSKRFYGAGAEVFFNVLVQSKITGGKTLTDGWIVLGWLSLFILNFKYWLKNKPITYLSFAIFSYLFVFLLFGSESYGWYRFPFYPFLVIATSRLIIEIYRSPSVLFLPLVLLPFGTSVHRLLGVEGFQHYLIYFRLAMIILFTVFLVPSLVKIKYFVKLQRLVLYLTIFFLIWLSVKEIYFYSFENWIFAT